MKSTLFKGLCRLLVVTLTVLSFQTANAAMIGADQVATAYNAQADREVVLNLLSRAEVSNQLQSMGLDPKLAKDRVAAMTDEEVHTLAGKIDQLPAGANISGWGWFAIVVVIAAIVYFAFGWKR